MIKDEDLRHQDDPYAHETVVVRARLGHDIKETVKHSGKGDPAINIYGHKFRLTQRWNGCLCLPVVAAGPQLWNADLRGNST